MTLQPVKEQEAWGVQMSQVYEVIAKNYNNLEWVYWKAPSTLIGVIGCLIYATLKYDMIEVRVRYSPTRWRLI